ncbi:MULTISPECIES: hypothetical protein [unclassified Kribbella]|uniref:hypothetical protein n=1 Tax=unclassified Kribbella TaxID=2644121 RepID=UPI0037BC5A2F|nr:hypothetical protein OG817_06715 [Kribbella sp. NBC_00889]
MRREDVQPMLAKASDRLPEPDLADAAWAAGVETRRRRRRSILIGLISAVLIAVIAAIGVGLSGDDNSQFTPPITPPSDPAVRAPDGQINGIDFWVAPPSGSERFLDRLETPLGDLLQLPDNVEPLADRPLDRIAAVVLEDRGDRYVPLLLGSDSSWARADVELLPIRTGTPLSSGAVSPDGRIAAFPQPGELVTVNVATAEVFRIKMPAQDIRSVSWLPDAQRVLVSGPGIAYRVLVGESGTGEEPLVAIAGAADPSAVTAPFRLDKGAVLRYMVGGQWIVDSALQLPVRAWVGQTFSTDRAAARLFIADDLTPVTTEASQPQVVAAISTLRAEPSRLLVLGDPTVMSSAQPMDEPYAREPGCCAVLGWYDHDTPLFEVRGWVLAWDLNSGRVRRVTELAVAGLAVGPGIRP